MNKYFGPVLMIVTLSLTVTSQPVSIQDTRYIWNSRKIGNKKVATLSIRKDEERDRRSITQERSSNSIRQGDEWHQHRHHHGEGVRLAMWLADEHISAEHEDESPRQELNETFTRTFSPPLYFDELSLGDKNRRRPDGVHTKTIQVKNHMPSVFANLEGRKILKTSVTIANQSNAGRNNKKYSKKGKRNSRGHKRRKTKGCRRLKGMKRRECLNGLRQCRHFKRRKKKKCRANVLQAIFKDTDSKKKPEIFSFIKKMTEMSGKEACHYHQLKKCSIKVGLFTEGSDDNMPVKKCHFRKEFIKCIQNLQQRETCDTSFHLRGDITTLRRKIKEFVWTPNSCLISDVVKRSMQK